MKVQFNSVDQIVKSTINSLLELNVSFRFSTAGNYFELDKVSSVSLSKDADMVAFSIGTLDPVPLKIHKDNILAITVE